MCDCVFLFIGVCKDCKKCKNYSSVNTREGDKIRMEYGHEMERALVPLREAMRIKYIK